MAATMSTSKVKKNSQNKKGKKFVRYFDQEISIQEFKDGMEKADSEKSLLQDEKGKRKKADLQNETKPVKELRNTGDPFKGSAPVPAKKIRKYERGEKIGKHTAGRTPLHKMKMKRAEANYAAAAKQAARAELLLPEEEGFLEADEGEETYQVSQREIVDAVDIASATKHFELRLEQFGPYRIDFTRNGRNLLLGGKLGHLAGLDWITKKLMFEINVMETIRDVQWLHLQTMLAVAQKKWLYIYDNIGTELHCVKAMSDILRLEFLPYHFLLVGCTSYSALQYLDVSVGKMVTEFNTRMGRLDVMCQNPQNAVIHLGHPNGTVTLWSPNMKEPLVKMLCHKSAVRSVAVDAKGLYMATSGIDRQLKIFDVRTFKPLQCYKVSHGAGELVFSQRGLLAAACGNVVEVFKDCCTSAQEKPYMVHKHMHQVSNLAFCPYEDVIGVGHEMGYTSLLIPGAGEPNFDALEANPYMSKKQKREIEVKALLEKIQPELIGLDPSKIGDVDHASFKQKQEERRELFGFVPTDKFEPRHKMKGKSSAGKKVMRKQAVAEQEKRETIREEINKKEVERRKTSLPRENKSALDRFKK